MQFCRSADGPARTLSAYYPCTIYLEKPKLLFHSATHLYAWYKCRNPIYRAAVINAQDNMQGSFMGTPMGMQFINRHRSLSAIHLRSDWPQKRVKLMRYVLTLKYQQNPLLTRFLLETSGKLVEADGIQYWCYPENTVPPKNEMGKMLMQLRTEFSIE